MAYISFQPNDYFNTLLYTDNGANRTLTGVGFQPDWVWIKTRNHANSHNLFDSVRGANKTIRSNLDNAEVTTTDTLTAFTSDGFSLGVDASGYGVNYDNKNEVSWNWKAGNSAGSSNSDGNITSTVSVNTTAGFSIVKYTGNETGTRTIGHGLGAVPQMIIVKNLDDGSLNWPVYHHRLGNTKYLLLNDTAAQQTSSNYWADTTPTSSVFSVGGNHNVNQNSKDFIAYCFAEKNGFSKFGRYVGNGNADGQFMYTGFKPAWLMLKQTGTQGWFLVDNKRPSHFNPIDGSLHPNSSAVEDTSSDFFVDFLANGFKLRDSDAQLNGNNNDYIYAAFAAEPLVSSNNIPATAR